MTTYAIDDAGRLSGWLYPDATRVTFAYHQDGNRTLTDNDQDPVGNRQLLADGGSTTTYTYDEANQLVGLEDSGGATSLTYDQNGNQSVVYSEGAPIFTLTWDYEDRMTAAEFTSLELSFTATYDPDHRRVAGREAIGEVSESAEMLWDGENVLRKYSQNASTLSTHEPVLYGNLISQRIGSDSIYHHYDALGSSTEITDIAQSIINRYAYTAFGLTALFEEAIPTAYLFVGQLGYQMDNPIWFYIRRRYYAPALGRWFSRDPVRIENILRTWSVYEYVQNNPARYPDPSGLRRFGLAGSVCVSRMCRPRRDPRVLVKEEDSNLLVYLPEPGSCMAADAIFTPKGVLKIPDVCQCTVNCPSPESYGNVSCCCTPARFGFTRPGWFPAGEHNPFGVDNPLTPDIEK